MSALLDFPGLQQDLLARCPEILKQWFPLGRVSGGWFLIGDVSGAKGGSLTVSLTRGIWTDQATGGGRYGDLCSLYAASRGLSMADAFRELGGQELSPDQPIRPPAPRVFVEPVAKPLVRPPKDVVIPKWFGDREAETVWVIRDEAGDPLHLIARFKVGKEGKSYNPFIWSDETGNWQAGGPPAPRPLYGMERLYRKQAPVLIVEGEKCAAKVNEITQYTGITWTGGAQAWAKADWTPIYGRPVIIWPDNDPPGLTAAQAIAGMLKEHCPVVKIVDVSDMPPKGDICDLGFTEKEQVYEWLSTRTSEYVAATVTPLPTPEPVVLTSVTHTMEFLNLERNDKGVPTANLANAAKVLRAHPDTAQRLYTDTFAERTYFRGADGPTEVTDTQILAWQQWMQLDAGLTRITKMIVADAAMLVGSEQSANPVEEYLHGLQWDQTRRLDYWLSSTVGAPVDDYHLAVSRNFWIGLVARALRPGCQMDNMLVLWGKGGWKKTSLFRTIGGEWYMEMTDSVDSKDFFVSLAGKLVVEISEMDSFSKSDVSRVKQIITMRSDRYRAPYGMRSEDHPRKAVFVGTTNDPHFLKDSTGNRRFMPVEVRNEIDCAQVAQDRDQLFAEAVQAFMTGESWWEYPAETTAEIQEASRQDDPWESHIRDFLDDRMICTPADVFENMKIDRKDQKPADAVRISRILRMLGCVQGKGKIWRKE